MDAKQIGQMLLNRIDVKGLLIDDLMVGFVKEKLEKVVADSANSFDDAALAMLWPLLEKAMRDGADKLIEKVED